MVVKQFKHFQPTMLDDDDNDDDDDRKIKLDDDDDDDDVGSKRILRESQNDKLLNTFVKHH